ncbi:MAG: DUF2752 domain-containing protein [Desulfobacterales bacterium]
MQVLIAKIVESYNPAYEQSRKTDPCGDTGKSRHLDWFFTPVLAPLLLNRRLIGIFIGVGVTQLILVATGLNGWQCPIKSTFGIICPGCGMTTAMTLLVRGQWAAAVGIHAYAPLFIVILASMMASILLPAVYLKKFSTTMAILERKTGITAIMMLGMVLYWLLRIFV